MSSTPKGRGRGKGSGPRRAGNRHRVGSPAEIGKIQDEEMPADEPREDPTAKDAPEEPLKADNLAEPEEAETEDPETEDPETEEEAEAEGDPEKEEEPGQGECLGAEKAPEKGVEDEGEAEDGTRGGIRGLMAANGVTPTRVILNAVLLLALAFASWHAFGTAQKAMDRKAGVVAVVNGTKITLEDLKKGSSTPALADVAAEDVLNLCRQKAFAAYLDDEGVPPVADSLYKESLESYIGTMTVEAAAQQYAMTPEDLEREIRFDLRMAEYRKEVTGLGDAPEMPEDSEDASAAAEYQSAMEAYTKAAEAADSKWQDLLEKVFLAADVRLYTLGVGGY